MGDVENESKERVDEVKPYVSDEENARAEVAAKLPYGAEDSELVSDLTDLYCRKTHATNVFPVKVGFETQEGDEQVILILRQAFVTNFGWIGIGVLMMFAPWLIGLLDVFPVWISNDYLVFVAWFWELFVLGYMVESYLRWYYNIYILTDRRVVDIDFPNLLLREMSDADLDKIQDVTTRSAGLMAAFFHYGDILVQTAAEITVFEFESVERPEKVSSVIRLLAQKYNKK